jgi:hypothetical protein
MTSLKRTALWLAGILSMSAAQAADMTPAEEQALQEHRAACVAALTTLAEPLAARLKKGDHGGEDELLGLTESGFALIGAAYRDGLRKPEADKLLDAAKKTQKALPAPELAKLQAACKAEGVKVLADASMLEHFLVTTAARKRVTRIAEQAPKTSAKD